MYPARPFAQPLPSRARSDSASAPTTSRSERPDVRAAGSVSEETVIPEGQPRCLPGVSIAGPAPGPRSGLSPEAADGRPEGGLFSFPHNSRALTGVKNRNAGALSMVTLSSRTDVLPPGRGKPGMIRGCDHGSPNGVQR